VKFIKKVLLAVVVIFAVFYVVTRPEDAAAAVRNAFRALGTVFNAIRTFFASLAS
jgi:hypothetical protein